MLEALATGVGSTPDLAIYEALQNAVRQETKILVQTNDLVLDGAETQSHGSVWMQGSAYVAGYQLKSVKQEGDHFVVKVLAKLSQVPVELPQVIRGDNTIDGPLMAIKAKAAAAWRPFWQQEPQSPWPTREVPEEVKPFPLSVLSVGFYKFNYQVTRPEVVYGLEWFGEKVTLEAERLQIRFKHWIPTQLVPDPMAATLVQVRFLDSQGEEIYSQPGRAFFGKTGGTLTTYIPRCENLAPRFRTVSLAWE